MKNDASASGRRDRCVIRLYVADQTTKALQALARFEEVKREFADLCTFEVVDLLENPALAREENIVALPTLIRKEPLPEKRLIGMVRDMGQVSDKLGLAFV